MNLRVLALSTALLAAGAVWSVPARTQDPGQRVDPFVVREEMIPMRDGVRLHTKIFVPREPREPLPFIMLRTPYGIEGPEGQLVTYLKALADEGYIFVFQDIRGKFGSEGAFVMQRPARTPGDTSALDEGTDTYDTIDWLLQERPSQQRACRHARRVVRRLDDDHGRARAASRAQSHLAPGLAGRHVAGRRLPPQRRLPIELWVRVRLQRGRREGLAGLSVRSLRHLRLVSRPGAALQRQRALLPPTDSDVERLRRAPRLRRVLETADAGAAHP